MRHACALDDEGSAYCWGSGFWELGDGLDTFDDAYRWGGGAAFFVPEPSRMPRMLPTRVSTPHS